MGTLSAGERLLHFRILSKIGEGGMGEVYLAEDQKLGRKVALKVLPASAAGTEHARARLIQEARSASALNHANIVTIHSIEETGTVDFIVMEYVEGETLAARLRRGVLPLSELLEIHRQIAEGLGAAHDAGVIHRDVKSSNILITNQRRVKILDFGLAKITSMSAEDLPTGFQELTKEGTILGTVSYMSPEQVRGEPLDSRSDIFSFGCVLYESATGRLPFRGPTPMAVMSQILSATVIPPSSLNPDLPAKLDTIVMQALSRDKGFRYSSARQMGEDLYALGFPETIADSSALQAVSLPKRDEAFVGREGEMQKLQDSFQAMTQGLGGAVFLTGEPGIGKTSLSEEFLSRVASSYPHVLSARGRCVEHYGTGEAYLPFLDAIGSAFNGPFKDAVVQVLRAFAPTWCMQFPGAFTSTTALENSQKEAAFASKERMLREISDALVELSTGRPLILFFEDLHWADPSTADLLRYLCRRVQGQRILILGTFREEDLESGNPPMKACRLDLQAHSISDEIHMDLFTRLQVDQYLDRFYSPNRFPKELSAMIFRKTEGHPLFIASLTQFLASQNVITKQGDVWSIREPFSESDLEMPENVRSMIRTKMEALPEEDRRILQYASIEGEEFSSIVLAGLLGMDEIDLEERLSRVERGHRMIRKTEEEDWPDGSLVTKYRFVHALYQNAFYGDIVTKRRVQLHRLAGEALLKHYGAKAQTIANKLGNHFQQGRDFEKAARYLSLAGDHAKTVHANEEAAHLYGQALKQIHELTLKDPATWKPVAAGLLENRADAFAKLGRQEEAKKELTDAQRLLEPSDTVASARLHRKIAKAVETQRLFDEAMQHYGEAQRLVDRDLVNQSVEWQREWLQISLDKTWLFYTQNLTNEMMALIKIMEPFVERIGTRSQQLHFYQCSVLLNNRLDRYSISDETLELLERSRKAAEEIGSLEQLASTNFVSGFCYLWRSDLDRSEEFLKQSLSQILRVSDAVLHSRCLTYLTVLHRRRNQVDETQSYAERSLDLARSIHMQEYVAAATANLGWVRWRENSIEESKELCTEAIRIWQSLPLVSPFQELALWPLIGISLRENQIEPACRYVELILHPSQRRLDPSMEKLLRDAIESPREVAHELLQQAAKIAESQGYL